MNIEVRPFRSEDLNQVYEIERRSFLWPWSRGAFIYFYHTSPELFLVAIVDGEVVGYVMGEIEENEEMRVGHVVNIAVSEEYRRKGIGTRLMEEMERRFQALGAKRVRLEVREANGGARAFYKYLGYRETGRLKRYYWGLTAIRMEKTLRR
jgi:ribosomal-protein-alanine N-acetyltransferase